MAVSAKCSLFYWVLAHVATIMVFLIVIAFDPPTLPTKIESATVPNVVLTGPVRGSTISAQLFIYLSLLTNLSVFGYLGYCYYTEKIKRESLFNVVVGCMLVCLTATCSLSPATGLNNQRICYRDQANNLVCNNNQLSQITRSCFADTTDTTFETGIDFSLGSRVVLRHLWSENDTVIVRKLEDQLSFQSIFYHNFQVVNRSQCTSFDGEKSDFRLINEDVRPGIDVLRPMFAANVTQKTSFSYWGNRQCCLHYNSGMNMESHVFVNSLGTMDTLMNLWIALIVMYSPIVLFYLWRFLRRLCEKF